MSLAATILTLVTLQRLGELVLARRNTEKLKAGGAIEVGASHYPLVVAVHAAVAAALERARGGGGPHLVEALTYRLCDHTTADDASRYRNDAEVSRHWPEEPVLRRLRWEPQCDHHVHRQQRDRREE